MWVVVDTNQVSRLPGQFNRARLEADVTGITLAPYVLAEVLLRTNPKPSLEKLQRFNIRVGLEPAHVMKAIAELTETEIVGFEPFPVAGTQLATLYGKLAWALTKPPHLHRTWAQSVKKQNNEFCSSLIERAKASRKKARNQKISKVEDISGTIQSLVDKGPTSFIGSIFMPQLLEDPCRTLTGATQESLYNAVMRNPYLARFFKTILYYTLSFSRFWADQTLNFDPNARRDDWTDITLSLYAADGDIILTEDNKLRDAVKMVNPSGVVAKSIDQLQIGDARVR